MKPVIQLHALIVLTGADGCRCLNSLLFLTTETVVLIITGRKEKKQACSGYLSDTFPSQKQRDGKTASSKTLNP